MRRIESKGGSAGAWRETVRALDSLGHLHNAIIITPLIRSTVLAGRDVT